MGDEGQGAMASKLIEPELEPNQASEVPRQRMAERWSNPGYRKLMLGGAAALLVLATALFLYYHNRESTDDAEVDGHITPIASKIYGTVAEVLVDDNQPVKAGQVLVRIDPRDYQVKVDQARAALALAAGQAHAADIGVPWIQGTTQSGVSAAQAQMSAAEADAERAQLAYQQAETADLAYAQAQVSKRQADNDRAQADLARMKPLLAKAEISQQQYDAFLDTAREAESEVKAAQEKLSQARQEAGIRKAAMQAAQARVAGARAGIAQAHANTQQVPMHVADASSAGGAVAQARANLAAAELELGYASIVAPVDGVVTKKAVEPGQIVQPGQGLFVLIPLHDIWVTANFKETQLARVRPGQKAQVFVDMYGRSFPGHVDSIASATGARLSLLPPENATGNYVKVVQRIPVKIVLDPIPPEKAVLRPGMNVEATIFTR
jgi:membrane fusion protein (multidrug efflux system)